MTLSLIPEIENQATVEYAKITSEIKSCNSIKFAAYRTASKLLVLQKSLGFSRVTLQMIKGVLEQHHLRITDNYLVLSIEEIENILHDIYFAASNIDVRNCVDIYVELSKLLLIDIFLRNDDPRRITVLDLKIVLACLCSSSLYSKYLYWFSQLLDHNLCLPRRRFHILLQSLLLITNYLSESITFSYNLIQPTLDSCYTEMDLPPSRSSDPQPSTSTSEYERETKRRRVTTQRRLWTDEELQSYLEGPGDMSGLEEDLDHSGISGEEWEDENVIAEVSQVLQEDDVKGALNPEEEHHLQIGLSENDFATWLAKEPQLLVWLSTFYRLSISEKVTHNTECSVCGMFPIVGLRYHCLRCIKYDLCQLCFFMARSSKHHKSKHLIKEYCSQTTFIETASTFLKEIFKRICGQSAKLQYLPVSNNFECKRANIPSDKFPVIENEEDTVHDTLINNKDGESTLRKELQKIILDIEKETSNLMSEEADTKHLINHQVQFLEQCLDRVKVLQAASNSETITVALPETDVSSCPASSFCISPIDRDSSLYIPSMSGFSTWIEDTNHETIFTKQLQNDLDNIMIKLNNMLESNFSNNDDE